MEALVDLFKQHISLNEEELKFLKENIRHKQVPKNHVLLREGAVSKEFYFVVKGCLRLYYLSEGEEKTAYFYTENMFASSYQSFTKQIPAQHNIATIEDCELIVFDTASAPKFLSFSPKFEFLARIIMEDELAVYQDIISSFVTQNAEARYIDLVKKQPELVQRIPQHQLATFLGVTPETLSRIRNRISQK